MKKIILLLLPLALIAAFAAQTRTAPYTAHEWGTFTSAQGGDGVLLQWRPLETSQLPGFVYDWTKLGLDRTGRSAFLFGKGTQWTLQRMETPVIYFYSSTELAVDVSVRFPEGFITEWYPQVTRIGPSTAATPGTTPESRIDWTGIRLVPAARDQNTASLLPSDKSGSHYFAARETDSTLVRVDPLSATNAAEHEKFLFYRGVGNFQTPLQVRMTEDGELTVTNTGAGDLAHLFVLTLNHGEGTYFRVEKLARGESHVVRISAENPALAEKDLENLLGRDVATALVAEGLFPREAAAMVNTWKDSWFAEDGVRVLYLMPTAWTDATLPMTLAPAPESLVRVMVGRAEVITPGTERRLREQLAAAAGGDETARENVRAEFKTLGRFAEPALRLALKDADVKMTKLGWELLQPAVQQQVQDASPVLRAEAR
jgi:hypothetical protein